MSLPLAARRFDSRRAQAIRLIHEGRRADAEGRTYEAACRFARASQQLGYGEGDDELHLEATQWLEHYHASHRDFERAYALGIELQSLRTRCAVRRDATAPAGTELSARELECLRLCAAGLTAPQSARRLGVSEWTVVYHLEKIKRRLGVKSKTQLLGEAAQRGWIGTAG